MRLGWILLQLLLLLQLPRPAHGNTLTQQRCQTNLALSDSDRSESLNQEEFAHFISRIDPHGSYSTYASVPAEHQAIYMRWSTPNPNKELNVQGANPSFPRTDMQLAALTAMCNEFMGVANEPTPAPNPVPVPVVVTPVPGAVPAPAPVPGAVNVPFATCRVSMAIQDSDRNNALSQQEYVGFLNRLTGNQRGFTTFAGLPLGLQTNFNTLAGGAAELPIPGASPQSVATSTPAQQAALEKICIDTQAALNSGANAGTGPPTTPGITAAPQPVSSPVLSPQICRVSLAIANAPTRSNRLTNQEYVAFINRLTGNKYTGATFEALPQDLQANFVTLAAANPPAANAVDPTTIDITGAQPAEYNAATPEQKAFLDRICADTQAITTKPAPVVPVATVPPGTPAPVTTTPPGITLLPFIQCRARMHAVDTDRNYYMSPTEYVQFVNRLRTGNAYTTFDSLPPALQQNYYALTVNSPQGININGALPSQQVAPAQLAYVEQVCTDTQVAMGPNAPLPATLPPSTVLPGTLPPGTLVPVPTGPPTPHRTVDLTECKLMLNRSDTTGFTYLARDYEYPNFANQMAVSLALPAVSADYRWATLDVALRQNFEALARNVVCPLCGRPVYPDNMDIYGVHSIIQAANATEQQKQFLNTICVNTAYSIQDALGRKDTPFPTCKAYMTQADVDNNLQMTQTECVVFVHTMVTTQVKIGEPWPYDVTAGLPPWLQEICTELMPPGETTIPIAGVNPPPPATATAEQEANLQRICTETDVGIYSALNPRPAPEPTLAPETAPPTVAPSPGSGGNRPGENSDGGNNTIPAVISVGFLALIALGLYFAWNDKDKIKKKWREFRNRRRHPKGAAGDEEAIDEEIGELGLEGQEEGDEEYDREDEYDEEYEDEFDEEDDGKHHKKGKRAKKLLGALGGGVNKIGKKVGLGGHDDEDDLGFGFQEENLLDFEDYIFDTPAELLTEQNMLANTFGEEMGGKGGRDATKRGGALATSIVPGPTMTDSVASSTSSMEGSEMSGEDDYDDYEDEFDDEYDSDDSEEDEEGDSFELSLSDDGEDTISSKGDDFENEGGKDDGSLSSSDEQGAEGNALLGGDVEGMLAAAKNSAQNGEGSDSDDDNDDDENDDDDSESGSSYYSDSTSSSHEARLAEYRNEVKELVAKVIPEELDNLSTMMDQFEGREAELINTLQNMEERTSTQRARAAVHKTKVKANPNQVGGYSIASEGSAVIAAASTLGPEPQRRQPRAQQYYDDDGYDDEYSDEYSDDYDDEYYDEDGEYYSDEYSGEYDDEYDDEEGSYYSGEEGSYFSGDDEEGSYYSGEEESYYSGDEEEGSYISGEEEGSYISGEGDYDDDYDDDYEEGSNYSGEEEEGSYFSGDEEEGSYVSGEGEYDDDYEEGSYISGEEGEEEGSYYSGDEEEYYSGEEEGSYVSGEGEDDYYDEDDGDYD